MKMPEDTSGKRVFKCVVVIFWFNGKLNFRG